MYKLREISIKDMETINLWRNNPELIQYLGAPYRFIDLQVDKEWFDNYMKNRNTTIRCSIVDKNDKILGLISLVSINYINQSAELHIMIGMEEERCKGMGTFAICTMIEHAFIDLNLQRIQLSVLEDNLRAIHVYEKIGFKREGVLRQCVYKQGVFKNLFIYGILRNEYTR